ncbi:acyl-CoA/acyl-ACP dehydrogenase [Amycolatopsis acidiphila]|uniref:Acyl-CoA dehydrogenase n=1 Tax=Amycolatopsis acidiphila TaxID=715473 RepID=A0A558AEX2_9PSEU|nr:acyl-CoA dehydrogenase family protein [Amycolatopsis acidiphila]TVT22802.1 acyl-CoA dehydrogenase [Amycolatopsis acidiphila]UIJ58185.1 acyl-CoA/acyl-ACP dehydrogenase [Amycolatopsis acidiphila]GHG69563.1 acyl-CoA dehydrogenase [Amycolatopsis acidiphila]
MDFTLDETQRDIAGLAADILGREIDFERPPGERGYDEQVWRALGKAGLLALALPPELGGDGLGPAEVAVLLTELGRAAAPVPALTLACGLLPLEFLGTPDQRATLLPEIATGEVVVTAAVHEPSAPLVEQPSTRAVADGGRWLLTGVKTGVPHLAAATRVLVPVSMPGGTGVFLVDPRAEGVTIAGTTMRLDGVAVEEADQLRDREPGEALATVRRYLLAGMIALGDGVLAGALALTTKHVGQREQFGRPLATFQAVAQQIADVYIASRTVHLAALSAVWRLASGRDPQPDLDIAAYWLAHEGPKALAVCHHLHGGLGVDITYPLHRYYALIKELSACTSI